MTPMKRTAKKPKADYRSHCPVNFAVESLGDRWALLIVRDMVFHGKKTYGEFLKAEEGIATNILASRLDFLERIEVIKKSPHGEDQRKDIYTLTEKGLDLIPVLFEFIKWSAKHDPLSSAVHYPPVFEATPSQPREVQQKSAGFGSFWKLPFYKCDSPMKMVRAEGAIRWINSGDLLCARNGSGVKRDRHLYLEAPG